MGLLHVAFRGHFGGRPADDGDVAKPPAADGAAWSWGPSPASPICLPLPGPDRSAIDVFQRARSSAG